MNPAGACLWAGRMSNVVGIALSRRRSFVVRSLRQNSFAAEQK